MAIRKAWDLVEKAKQDIENLSVEQVKAELASGDDVLLVDVREVQELVDLGTLPGAVHVPRGMLEFWADPSTEYYRDYFRPERRTILYCAAGGRSALAAKALRDMGYTNVAHLESGFGGWKSAGEPIEDFASKSRWVRRQPEAEA